MCVTSILRRVGYKETNDVAKLQAADTPVCLFGEYCAMVGHTHVVYQDDELEICAGCDYDSWLRIAHWSLATSTASFEEPRRCAERPPPPSAIDTFNKTVQNELRAHLSRHIAFGKCKALLHYLLGLPWFIEKRPLIDIFGESVGRWCGSKQWELKHLAAEHDLDRELGYALKIGMKLHQKNRETVREKRKRLGGSKAPRKAPRSE
ncbi:hypothetical protein F5Y19DRAFT_489339 [Xylariaceae sp. FL1651]|nr:hypothetical protein F5Y19DRAFT_489339 [Xylariaceae sp. FL1651]